jgi:hypothetical protein
MSFDSRQWLDRYQPYRRSVVVGFWVVFFLLQATVNTVIVRLDIARVEFTGIEPWEPLVWEWSSNLVLLALIPAVIAFERRFPLLFGRLRLHLAAHALGSVVFSAIHVGGMVGLRKLAYAWVGENYDFGNWLREFGYEYLKDVQSYFAILAIVLLYRLLLLRLQGEARLLDAPPSDAPPVAPAVEADAVERPERFLVRMLGKEFLLAAADIECLQASGNYVNLRVRGRDYPLRSTLTALMPMLDPARFVRVHRSWAVNLDFLAEIEPLDTGDARLSLRDGTKVPCSRTYRAALRGGAGREAGAAQATSA